MIITITITITKTAITELRGNAPLWRVEFAACKAQYVRVRPISNDQRGKIVKS